MSDYWSDEFARSIYCGGDQDECRCESPCKWHLEHCVHAYPKDIICGHPRWNHSQRKGTHKITDHKFEPARPTASDAVQSSPVAAKPDPGQVGQAGDDSIVGRIKKEYAKLHDETGDPRKCAYCAAHHAYIEPPFPTAPVYNMAAGDFVDVGPPAPGAVFVNSDTTKRDLLARLEAADNEIRRGYTVTDVDQGIELGFKAAIDTVRRYFE